MGLRGGRSSRPARPQTTGARPRFRPGNAARSSKVRHLMREGCEVATACLHAIMLACSERNVNRPAPGRPSPRFCKPTMSIRTPGSRRLSSESRRAGRSLRMPLHTLGADGAGEARSKRRPRRCAIQSFGEASSSIRTTLCSSVRDAASCLHRQRLGDGGFRRVWPLQADLLPSGGDVYIWIYPAAAARALGNWRA
ncbi:hypothetical protein ACVWXN_010841 [Bradyrhizobium sp. i1.4.4]